MDQFNSVRDIETICREIEDCGTKLRERKASRPQHLDAKWLAEQARLRRRLAELNAERFGWIEAGNGAVKEE